MVFVSHERLCSNIGGGGSLCKNSKLINVFFILILVDVLEFHNT